MTHIDVAAAVLFDEQGRVLINERPAGKSHAGEWEFPGGKIEAGESPRQAVVRELEEELGVHVEPADARPLIGLTHDYPDKRVRLHVWQVERFSGRPTGREQQRLAWVSPADLSHWPLLPADAPIVTALQLPDRYLITPDLADPEVLLQGLARAAARGVRLGVLRVPSLEPAAYAALAVRVLASAQEYGIALLLHGTGAQELSAAAAGRHLPARMLHGLSERPVASDQWLAVSCHDAEELARARALGADFAVLGPVRDTLSHPGVPGRGWEWFGAAAASCGMPVYALGGLDTGDIESAWQAGGQGIAAIRGFWTA